MKTVVQSSTPGMSLKQSGVWLVALGAALWGTSSYLRNTMLTVLTSSQIVLLEHLLLALFAIPVLVIGRRQIQQLNAKDWGAILFISWGGSAIATILFTAAFQYGNPNVVVLLQKLQPIFVLLMARFLLKEVLPRSFRYYMLVALIGAYLLTFGFSLPLADFSDGNLTAALLAIGAAALWGGSTVMGRHLTAKLSFETVTAARFLMALPLLAALVAINGEFASLDWSYLAQATGFGSIVMSALVPGLFSLLLYYRGLSTTQASYATAAELAFPATALLLNWIALGQGLTLGQAVGFGVIWLTIFKMSTSQNAATK